MGVWGYFSHENDLVSDEWLRFTELYIKKYHSHINVESGAWELPVIEKEKINVANFMIKFLRISNYDNESLQLGLINLIVKLNNKEFPSKLFPEFPDKLRKKACLLVKKELKGRFEEWEENREDRIEALHKEARLYNCESLVKKGRKGPAESATLFNVGKRKKGLDGNYWIVKENANGTKRWVRDK